MTLKAESRRDVVEAARERYRRAGRAERGAKLDELVALTGYHRNYLVTLLKSPRSGAPRTGAGGRPVVYSPRVLAALQVAATATGWICGKRLAPFLAELVPALERAGELRLEAAARTLLLGMSAATIDRRLAGVKRGEKPRGLGATRRGGMLKHQVPVRTWTPWDEQRPGFVEIDLVAHCGTSLAGDHLFTLTVVDIATGWTECAAVANKGQAAVFAAVEAIRRRLPFPLLGLDSDNGSEFLNGHLVRYCEQERLTYTRSRAYHKNDQAHVEQKNGAVVRELIGYDRYEGQFALAALDRVYALARLHVNAFLPVMKLTGKRRVGAKVTKHYDVPRSPLRRALAAGVLAPGAQTAWQDILQTAAPLALRRQLDASRDQLWQLRAGPRTRGASA